MPDIRLLSDNRLRESGGGLIEGMTETERVEKWGHSWRKLELGFEPQEEIISRGLDFIEEMKELHPGINESWSSVMVDLLVDLIKELVPYKDLAMDLENTSITIIKLQEDRNLCQLFNCTKHLQLIK